MKIYLLFAVIVLMCFGSCGKNLPDMETRTRYEILLVENPDSVLTLLKKDTPEYNDYKQMLLYYTQGADQYEKRDYPAAIISFFNAEKIAKEQKNKLVLGLIYHSLSDIYGQVYNHIEEQNYALMAYENFVLSGNNPLILSGLEKLAVANYFNKNYDVCTVLSQKLIAKASSSDNDSLQVKGLRILSNAYIQSKRYQDAKSTLLKLKSQAKTFMPQDYRNLCIAYMKTGQMDSAKIYRQFAKTDNQPSLWVAIKNPDTGQFIYQIVDIDNMTVTEDTVVKRIINLNLAQTVANYHAYEKSIQETELRNERFHKYIILCIAALFISFLSIWYRLHMKAHRKEMELKMLEAENIRHILNTTQENASSLQQSVNSLFEQKFKSIDELCNTYYVYQGSRDERTKIFNSVMDIISSLRNDKKTVAELETFVNTYKNNLMTDFRNEYPMLKEDDYLLFLYIVIDFSSRAISILIGESLPVVYNRKSSLKRKIQQGESSMKERFLEEFS